MLSISGTAGQCSINNTSRRARKPQYAEFCCLYTFIWYNLSGVAMGIEAMGLWIFIDNLRDPSAKKRISNEIKSIAMSWLPTDCLFEDWAVDISIFIQRKLLSVRCTSMGPLRFFCCIEKVSTTFRSRDENVILTTEGYFEKSPCRLQNSDLNCAPKWSWMMMRIEQLCMVKSSAYWSEHSNFARHFFFNT